MTHSRRFFWIIFVFALSSLLLSACASGAGAASSWPAVTVTNDFAYVAYNAHVYAVNLADHTEKWRYPQKAENGVTFYSAPALTPDGQLLAASYNKNLYSLNKDGQLNQNNWPFAATNHFIASPVVTDTSVFAPNADNNLYALDLKGALRWKFTTGAAQWSAPVIDGKTLYLSSMDHHVYAIEAESGKMIWKSDDLGGSIVGTPALDKDNHRLYVGTFGSEMVALEAQTGKVTWRKPTSGWVWGGPALANNRVYFGDLNGTFYALEAADGKEAWKIQPETGDLRKITDQPLVTKDAIYFASEAGALYALNPADGSQRWKAGIPNGKIYASPVAAGDLILVAPINVDTLLVAFDTNGNQKWTYIPAK